MLGNHIIRASTAAVAVMIAACASPGDEAEGLSIEAMTPEEGLRATFAADVTLWIEARNADRHFYAEVRADDGAVLARTESNFEDPPAIFLGGVQITGATDGEGGLAPEERERLRELLASPAGRTYRALTAELPWHVEGMHHEFLAIHQMYASLRMTAEAELLDDGFSLEANAARVARITSHGDAPGTRTLAVTASPNYPDMYICPGHADKCTGMCGTGCQGSFGIETYTCECLRHDLSPPNASTSIFQAAADSLANPGKHKSRTALDSNACSASYTPQSPAYYCGSYGAGQNNSRSTYADGSWWCFEPGGGEELRSPGPQYLATDWDEHHGWVDGRYRWIGGSDGTVHRFEETGRIKLGIAGKASGVVVASVSPGSALCDQFGGTCEPHEIDDITEDHIRYIIDTRAGCTFSGGSTGTTTSTGATCPDLPFYHAFGSHGFGWYDALHIPPGDYLVGVVSKSIGWSFLSYDGHATVTSIAYQGNGGTFRGVESGSCSARRGNGLCEWGEYGSNAPEDCCDASTPCGQTYMNQGDLWCRNMNGGGYKWLSDASPWCDESGEIGASTALCGGACYTCASTSNTWSQGCY